MSDLLNNLTYTEAINQLTKLLQDIEHGAIEIDQLDDAIQKAKDLTKFCETRLRNIEKKLEK